MSKTIGIDLGTTNSVVAFKDVTVRPLQTGPNNEELCRSCVGIDKNGNTSVGNHVYKNWKRYAPNIVVSAKRLMGASLSDPDVMAGLNAPMRYFVFGLMSLFCVLYLTSCSHKNNGSNVSLQNKEPSDNLQEESEQVWAFELMDNITYIQSEKEKADRKPHVFKWVPDSLTITDTEGFIDWQLPIYDGWISSYEGDYGETLNVLNRSIGVMVSCCIVEYGRERYSGEGPSVWEDSERLFKDYSRKSLLLREQLGNSSLEKLVLDKFEALMIKQCYKDDGILIGLAGGEYHGSSECVFQQITYLVQLNGNLYRFDIILNYNILEKAPNFVESLMTGLNMQQSVCFEFPPFYVEYPSYQE